MQGQRIELEAEGHTVVNKGKGFVIQQWEQALVHIEEITHVVH